MRDQVNNVSIRLDSREVCLREGFPQDPMLELSLEEEIGIREMREHGNAEEEDFLK